MSLDGDVVDSPVPLETVLLANVPLSLASEFHALVGDSVTSLGPLLASSVVDGGGGLDEPLPLESSMLALSPS